MLYELNDTERERIRSFTQKNLYLNIVREECQRAGVRVYLVGGALRDLLFADVTPNDIDIVVETKAETLESIGRSVEQRVNADESLRHYVSSVDIKTARNIEAHLLDFDFAINAIGWELNLEQFCDPTTVGLKCIRERKIEPVQGDFTAVTPAAHIRLVRFALTWDLTIPPDLKKLFRDYSGLVNMGTRTDYVWALNHLVDLVSRNICCAGIAMLHEHGTLNRILPELTPLLVTDQRQRFEEVLESIAALRKILAFAPLGKALARIEKDAGYATWSKPDKPSRRLEVRYSHAGQASLTLLLCAAFNCMRIESPSIKAGSARKYSSVLLGQYLSNMKHRVMEYPVLAKQMKQLEISCQTLLSYDELRSTKWVRGNIGEMWGRVSGIALWLKEQNPDQDTIRRRFFSEFGSGEMEKA